MKGPFFWLTWTWARACGQPTDLLSKIRPLPCPPPGLTRYAPARKPPPIPALPAIQLGSRVAKRKPSRAKQLPYLSTYSEPILSSSSAELAVVGSDGRRRRERGSIRPPRAPDYGRMPACGRRWAGGLRNRVRFVADVARSLVWCSSGLAATSTIRTGSWRPLHLDPGRIRSFAPLAGCRSACPSLRLDCRVAVRVEMRHTQLRSSQRQRFWNPECMDGPRKHPLATRT